MYPISGKEKKKLTGTVGAMPDKWWQREWYRQTVVRVFVEKKNESQNEKRGREGEERENNHGTRPLLVDATVDGGKTVKETVVRDGGAWLGMGVVGV